jgi:acyl-coenzyme A thioesterase PaaI-like protein
MEALPADQRQALMHAMQSRGVTPNPLLNFMGARFVELTDEHSVVELTISDNVRQQTGAVHASALIALADMAASVLTRRAAACD